MKRIKKEYVVRGKRRYLTVVKLTNRVMIVPPRQSRPANAAQRRHRKDFPDGSIIITRRDAGKLVPQLYKSVYDAVRSRLLTRMRYGATMAPGEEQQLVEMVWEARRNLDLLLGKDALEELERVQMQERLQELAQKLERSRNLWKEWAFVAMDAASDLFDSRGRFNPGAKAAQITAARKRLRMRVMEIPLILSFVTKDELALLEERDCHLEICRKILAKVEVIVESPVIKNPKKYEGQRSPQLNAWLDKRANELRCIRVLPFTKTRYHALRDIAIARKAGHEGNWVTAGRAFKRIASSLNLRLIQPRLEEVLIKIDAMIYIQNENTEWSRSFVPFTRQKLRIFLGDVRGYIGVTIDDQGFTKPVVRDLCADLDMAGKMLYTGELQAARDHLKKAIAFI